MSKKKNQTSPWLAFIIITIIFAAVIISTGCKKPPAEPTPSGNNQNEPSATEPILESPAKPEQAAAGSKTSLGDVIREARTWKSAYTHWAGKMAPDFTLTDINGKQHTLSDYRGKDVLIIFWASWCGPCKIEVPHLVALRNLIGEDKLAMLAISYQSDYPPESAEKVQNFVKQNRMNYTVFSTTPDTLPPPYNRISGIPCFFFIDSKGKIKLATEGLVSLGEIKAILRAE
ncbi:MAG: TlpA family protein disulfide reductase [Phycisphaerae bacterium]|jgi:peroxiredoxin